MVLELAGIANLSLPLSFGSTRPLLRLKVWQQLFPRAAFRFLDRLLLVERECGANHDPRRRAGEHLNL